VSGVRLDDVRVHLNSPRPSEFGALAYAHGTEVHIAPGAEEHLPHEIWHVVQQKLGRVQATGRARGFATNTDPNLEQEAHGMAAALSSPWATPQASGDGLGSFSTSGQPTAGSAVIQMMRPVPGVPGLYYDDDSETYFDADGRTYDSIEDYKRSPFRSSSTQLRIEPTPVPSLAAYNSSPSPAVAYHASPSPAYQSSRSVPAAHHSSTSMPAAYHSSASLPTTHQPISAGPAYPNKPAIQWNPSDAWGRDVRARSASDTYVDIYRFADVRNSRSMYPFPGLDE
jgi:hypothetical protein